MKTLKQKALAATAMVLLLVGASVPMSQAQNAGGMAGNAVQSIMDKRPIVHPNGLTFGAYDPHGDFAEQKDLGIEGLFLPWEDVDLESLRAADGYALARGRTLLITIEPWSWDVNWRLTSGQLRTKILNGEYDTNMRTIAEIIGEMKSPVIVRWGQEMEDTSGRFSWAGWDPQSYLTAYHRMMDIVRKEAPQAKLMWSPKGLPNLKNYYPGDDYADYVGLSVFGLEGYDEREYGAPQSFTQRLQQGYDLVQGYGKPVWVAELGYEGGDSYLRSWMQDVTVKRPEFPKLEAVVYFNDKEVHPWPYELGRPNWRVVREPTVN
ncbi:MAG: glycosyl hydrolase [Rhizobiaceae bacterium]|nr:glycosyl hydrolase [Rhizobiaceae bacterium]